jgi:hypothetical protein
MFDTDKVKVCKLVNGEFVVATVHEEEATDVISLAMGRNPENGGISINFAPFMYPFNDKFSGKTIKTSMILCTQEPDKQMYDNYITATTGIIPATSVPEELKAKSNIEIVSR